MWPASGRAWADPGGSRPPFLWRDCDYLHDSGDVSWRHCLVHWGGFSFALKIFFETFSSFLLLRVFGVLFDMSTLKRCYIGLPSPLCHCHHSSILVLADTRNSALVHCKYKISPRYPQQYAIVERIIDPKLKF